MSKIQLRSDTTANWESYNPVLLKSEVGIEYTDSGTKIKIGDGSSDWNTLPYYIEREVPNSAILDLDPNDLVSKTVDESIAGTKTFEDVVINGSLTLANPPTQDYGMSTFKSMGDISVANDVVYTIPIYSEFESIILGSNAGILFIM